MSILAALRRRLPTVGRRNQSAREDWLESSLARFEAGSRILDAGAGTQQYRRFCEHLDYVSQDFAAYDGRGDGEGLQTGEFDYGDLSIVSDIVDIPEPSASFDAIMCVEVLEHLPDPADAIREFSRLLKPGGELVLTAPFDSISHFAPHHYCSGFNHYWYETHLPSNGFRIAEITPNGNYFEYLAQEVYRIPSVSRRYSHTRLNLFELGWLYALELGLSRLSKRDSGSAELLCFGYHVRAIRE
jgi:ubiquinone/menaquinone biosynthesis C-methylase UbiE